MLPVHIMQNTVGCIQGLLNFLPLIFFEALSYPRNRNYEGNRPKHMNMHRHALSPVFARSAGITAAIAAMVLAPPALLCDARGRIAGWI